MSADLGPAWLAAALGLEIEVHEDATGTGLDAIVGLALRRNPRRAHLLVSRVLAKHVPVRPRRALAAAGLLAAQVPGLGGAPLVIGYAETATGLGHAVADALALRDPGTSYLHSTRRVPPGWAPALAFEEEHSHATAHRLLPADPGLLAQPRPVVLVDDELTTGRTACNTVRALHRLAPHPAYVVASLLDLRPPAARRAFEGLSFELGVPVVAAALVRGELVVPPDVVERARAVLQDVPAASGAGADPAPAEPRGHAAGVPVVMHRPVWPADLPDGARHGWDRADRRMLEDVLPGVADGLAGRLGAGPVLVVGTEELMYVPIRLAALLEGRLPGEVLVQSTTRSPVAPLDRDGYMVRSALVFEAPDEPGRTSYLYNLRPGFSAPDDVVLVTDAEPGASLLAALGACARRAVHVVRVPSFVPVARAA